MMDFFWVLIDSPFSFLVFLLLQLGNSLLFYPCLPLPLNLLEDPSRPGRRQANHVLLFEGPILGLESLHPHFFHGAFAKHIWIASYFVIFGGSCVFGFCAHDHKTGHVPGRNFRSCYGARRYVTSPSSPLRRGGSHHMKSNRMQILHSANMRAQTRLSAIPPGLTAPQQRLQDPLAPVQFSVRTRNYVRPADGSPPAAVAAVAATAIFLRRR
mmetsp:Transcript_18265/g.39250  ORF Transcript_18265/g.39250 Transcript_18265/m.39250 type:complete len:212 (+) Transcript_18265:296-931(+)